MNHYQWNNYNERPSRVLHKEPQRVFDKLHKDHTILINNQVSLKKLVLFLGLITKK